MNHALLSPTGGRTTMDTHSKQATLAPAIDSGRLAAEIAGLPPWRRLTESSTYVVYSCQAHEIPLVMLEIGRLREEAFRAVGEGSGRERDLDRYDKLYSHLFVWDTAANAIVGAYRYIETDRVEVSDCELYTHSLFDIAPKFHERLGPAIELGRSFVTPSYQRSYAPLFLLWRGIGALLMAKPRYRRLFGALTISSTFNPLSRSMMLQFLSEQRPDDPWRGLVRARRSVSREQIEGAWQDGSQVLHDLDELARAVEESEGGQRAMPVLLRQYVKLGARVFDFSLDPDFGNAIDALVVLDLDLAPRDLMRRYLGEEGVERFFDARLLEENLYAVLHETSGSR